MNGQGREQLGVLLVAMQFGLFFLLAALGARPALALDIPAGAWLAAAVCSALAIWTLSANRIGNFNIRPVPKAGSQLITSGPYRWIRHPMYTAFLLGALALAWTAGSALAWLAWVVLVIVLLAKSLLEERWMREQHAGYAAYSMTTRRFLPWLF
jgi:protein-S-isoprenylcysteine O-methyltransferase Ste14